MAVRVLRVRQKEGSSGFERIGLPMISNGWIVKPRHSLCAPPGSVSGVQRSDSMTILRDIPHAP